MCGYWMQNSDFWSGITSLYGSQTKPVVLCMQNSVISTRITSLYGFQPSSVVFACKTTTLGPDLQVCMCPSPNVWYWALITAFLEQEYQVYVGSSHHRWFCACKTATLGQVSVGPKPHLWFSACKTACLTSQLQSLWDPALNWSFCMQNNDFCTRITNSMGLRHHLSFCAYKTAWLAPEWLVSIGPSRHLWFLHEKQRLFDQNYKSL